jgi:hypothetical protein
MNDSDYDSDDDDEVIKQMKHSVSWQLVIVATSAVVWLVLKCID